MKRCPFCAEEIQDAAIKCRYCGSRLSAATQVQSVHADSKPVQVVASPRIAGAPDNAKAAARRVATILFGILGVFIVFIVLATVVEQFGPAAPVTRSGVTPPATVLPVAATIPEPVISPLNAFETSAFCKQYGCANHQSWALKTGATNHSYDLNLTMVTIEVPTKDERIESYGIVFSERDRPIESEMLVIDALLDTIDAPSATDDVRRFVRANIERPVFQIRLAKSTRFGRYRLWTGKVGNDEIVHIEPER